MKDCRYCAWYVIHGCMRAGKNTARTCKKYQPDYQQKKLFEEKEGEKCIAQK